MTVQFPLPRHEQKEYMNLIAEKLGRLFDSHLLNKRHIVLSIVTNYTVEIKKA